MFHLDALILGPSVALVLPNLRMVGILPYPLVGESGVLTSLRGR